jgi:sirohydrochlorin ferrochelatase
MTAETYGYIIVDHGSRVGESNAMLERITGAFQQRSGQPIVEPAHMELAQPSIATAFARCVDQGATVVVVCPFFLLPGRHWNDDIPSLTRDAARSHAGVRFLITAPLGLLPTMLDLIQTQIDQCVTHASGGMPCELCQDGDKCQFEG